jgi:hypothetical protein
MKKFKIVLFFLLLLFQQNAFSADKTISTALTATQSVEANSNLTVTSSGSIITTAANGSAISASGTIGDITIDGTVQTENSFLFFLNSAVEGCGATAGDITINGTAKTTGTGRGLYLNDICPNNIIIGSSGILSGGNTLTIHVGESDTNIRGNIINNGTITATNGYTVALNSLFVTTFDNNGDLFGRQVYAVYGGGAAATFDNSGHLNGRFLWGGSLTNTGTLTIKDNSTLAAPTTNGTPALSNADNGFVSSGTINIAVTGKTTRGTDYSSITTTTSNLSGTLNVDVDSGAGLSVGDVLTLVDGTSTATLGNLTIVDNSSDISFSARVASNGQDIELVVIANANDTPLGKPDAIGSIKAWTNSVSNTPNYAINNISKRLKFLKRAQEQSSDKTSSQAINLRFLDKKIDRLINTNEALNNNLEIEKNIFVLANNNINNKKNFDFKLYDPVKEAVFNQLVKSNKKFTGNKNIQFDSNKKISNWSWWTMGSIMIGDEDKTASASKLESKNKYITLGLDKNFSHYGILGASLMFGNNNTDIGVTGSNVSNDSYSLSIYNSFPLNDTFSIISTIGASNFVFDSKRIDSSQVLAGERTAKQGFFSLELREDGYNFKVSEIKNPVDLEWYIKGDAAFSKLNAFSESGGDQSLFFDDQNVESGHLRFGIDLKNENQTKNGKLIPYLGLEYAANLTESTEAKMRYVSENTIYTETLAKAYDHQLKTELGFDYFSDSIKFTFSVEHKEQFNSGSYQVFNVGLQGNF